MVMKPRRLLPSVVVVLALLAQACGALPSLQEERKKATALPQTSFLYAADGTLITQLHAGEDRVVVKFKNMPEVMRQAVIAIEDQRFYDHRGIDLKALLRAAYIDAIEGRVVEGGSTITQQLVKNLFVGSEESLSRKLKEAYLAWELEHKLTKAQILTKYLNTVYFGSGAYGVQAAAQTYFNEDASELTLAQAALLAGLIRAPVNYDPIAHPTHAHKRRNQVLAAMLEQGMIDAAAENAAAHEPIELDLGAQDKKHYIAPYFVDYFKEWFLSNPRFGPTPQDRYDLLFKGGLRITTTLLPTMQEQAERAVHAILPNQGDPYAAMTVLDPRTGYVRAMVGGRNYWDEKERFARINLATGGSTGRQTGSAFKPFALVAALENGFSPSSPLNGSTVSIPLPNGTTWQPHNAEGGGYGTISLETATIHSVNVAYANLEVELGGGNAFVGAEKIIEVAKRMGIRCCPRTTEPGTPLLAVPAAVLGANEVSTLEMATAYGTLAFGGQHIQPTPVVKIETADGEVLYEGTANPKQVVAPSIASVAVEILKGVVQSGTGTAANIGRPQFGKTGTEDLYRDAWFVGAIPQLVTAVWVGFPQGQISMQYPNTRITVFGGTWPAQIWHAFMANAVNHIPIRDFPTPTGGVDYVSVKIDITQGCLANPFTPPSNVKTMQFIAGTEPTKVCKEPSSNQYLTVPSVVGMMQSEAAGALRAAGFNVAVRTVTSSQPAGTVVAQDPGGGTQAQMTSTVTISVAGAGAGATSSPSPPPPATVTVPNLVGLFRGPAIAALRNAGLQATVAYDAKCDEADPSCDYRKSMVWSQSPNGGAQVTAGSTVMIVVNP
jgi:penicillin-binding protein 1A